MSTEISANAGGPFARSAPMPLADFQASVREENAAAAVGHVFRLGLVEHADWLFGTWWPSVGRRHIFPPYAYSAFVVKPSQAFVDWLAAQCPDRATRAHSLADVATSCVLEGRRAQAFATFLRAGDDDVGVALDRLLWLDGELRRVFARGAAARGPRSANPEPFGFPDGAIPLTHPLRASPMPLAEFQAKVTEANAAAACVYALRLGLVDCAAWLFQTHGQRLPPPRRHGLWVGQSDSPATITWLMAQEPAPDTATFVDLATGFARAGDLFSHAVALNYAIVWDRPAVFHRIAAIVSAAGADAATTYELFTH